MTAEATHRDLRQLVADAWTEVAAIGDELDTGVALRRRRAWVDLCLSADLCRDQLRTLRVAVETAKAFARSEFVTVASVTAERDQMLGDLGLSADDIKNYDDADYWTARR